MSELDKLIAMTNQLCNTLDVMADNERRYGFELGHKLEQMSYEAFKMTNELMEIKEQVRGVA